MRFYLTVFFIFGVATGAFAQLSWNLYCTFNVDSVKFRTPLGMNAEQSFTDPSGVAVLNRNYAGNQLRFFTQNDSFFGNEMLVGFYYPMEIMEFYCRINIDSLIRQNVTSYGNAPIGG